MRSTIGVFIVAGHTAFTLILRLAYSRAAHFVRPITPCFEAWYAARPGILIGRKGAELDTLKSSVAKLLAANCELILEVVEIKQPETNAQLVAESVAQQLERRIGFRRAMKKAIQTAMELGVEGIKIHCAGRLGGAELARTEQYKEGRTPLHTLKAHIDYGFTEANTTAGKIGVKVWICHKEPTEEMQNAVNAKKSKAQKGSAR